MLKKKILGAKVLDTNGFVLATRLITPNKAGKDHQLGDIYSANAIDEKLSKIEIGDNTDVNELKVAIAENKTAISDEQIRALQLEKTINENLQHAIKGISLKVDHYSDSGDEAYLVLSRGRFDVNNDRPVTTTVKLDFSLMHDDYSNRIDKERDARNLLEDRADKLETQIEALLYGLHIVGAYDRNSNTLHITLWRPDFEEDVISERVWDKNYNDPDAFESEVGNNYPFVDYGFGTKHWMVMSASDIDLSDVIDINDLVNSDTDTITTKDGKTSIKTNTLSKDDVQKMIDDTVNNKNNK